jgi:hypothetical protein
VPSGLRKCKPPPHKCLFLRVRAKANDLLILFSETFTVIAPSDKCGLHYRLLPE